MQTPAYDRLRRVIDLEEKQGWRNRGVIGGMAAMSERWAADASDEGADERSIQVLVALMTRYDEEEPETRPATASLIRAALDGDLTDIPHELADDRATTSSPQAVADAGDDLDDPDLDDQDWDDGWREDEQLVPPAEATDVAQARVARQRGRSSRADAHDLQAAPTILPGVGPARAELLAKLDIHEVVDLLWHLPLRYEDFSQLRTIDQLKPGEEVTIVANLWETRERKLSMSRQFVQGILADGTGTIHATWWNKWVAKKLEIGSTMRYSGKVGLYLGQLTLENPSFEDIDADMVATGRLTPVYPLTEGISNNWLRNLIAQVLDEYGQVLSDPLPAAIRERYQLPDLASALQQAHLPDDQESLQRALRRLAFAELFYLQLGVLQRRQELKQAVAPALVDDASLAAQFCASLPYDLTPAQTRVLGEITGDMARTIPMTRLVQGDVGSGKTAVAAAAMYVAASNGVQSALLAPTQILAEQHHRSIAGMMAAVRKPDGTAPSVALLTGRVTGDARAQVLEGLGSGAIDVVVGTTALIQETVAFAKLGFVVVDEQHRFGVEQRGALRSMAADQPHLLVMSATPIPRSLALTVYGDLDLSIIDELPPGRIPIQTKLFRPRERERLYRFLAREAGEGRQAFIIYPLVEESDKIDVGAAVEAHQQLSQEVFPELRLGLLHGRMSGAEKDDVMRAFAAGEYDALVSTSVIEVGIDVPNASLILIEDAERFGLAQLHQFRGRVGRGQHKSYCALISRAEGGDSEERLRALEESNDGFELAEKDLELRGPGDFLGTRQSGLPPLRIASLSDMETLLAAREAGQQLFAEDPQLENDPLLRRQVERFWRGHGDIN